MIWGNEYLTFTSRTEHGHYVVRITSKDDHWGDLATEERQRNAMKCRREFEVVDATERRPAIRFARCLTIMLADEGEPG